MISLERSQSLAIAAQARLAALGIETAAVVWGDGLALPSGLEPFDRIIAHGLVDPLPVALLACPSRTAVFWYALGRAQRGRRWHG